ncbi:MAG: hypothetical protein QOD93_7223 [Acetobacteraceae bacterium]|nr:hypothetical protein [Acetobacteraceae bacterium]
MDRQVLSGERDAMTHKGGCHCGNVRLTLRLSQPPDQTRLRACSCSFCRAHATRTTSDAAGAAEIWAEDWDLVMRYRFGSRTAEYLICSRCGVYIGAVCATALGTRAVINTNSLADWALFTETPAQVDHDEEATEERMARRSASWTPTILHR